MGECERDFRGARSIPCAVCANTFHPTHQCPRDTSTGSQLDTRLDTRTVAVLADQTCDCQMQQRYHCMLNNGTCSWSCQCSAREVGFKSCVAQSLDASPIQHKAAQ